MAWHFCFSSCHETCNGAFGLFLLFQRAALSFLPCYAMSYLITSCVTKCAKGCTRLTLIGFAINSMSAIPRIKWMR